MRSGKGFIAGILCAASLAATALHAGQAYVLRDGGQAVIEGNRLILIDRNRNRTVAPEGVYRIRGKMQDIVVTGETARFQERIRQPE